MTFFTKEQSEMENVNISHCDTSNYLTDASNITLSSPPRILQHKRSNSQKQKSNKATFSTNTFPYKLKRSNINNNSIRQQADIIRYIPSQNTTLNIPDVQRSSYIRNVFAPDVHSTPIYNCHSSKKTFSKIKKRNSIENSSIQNAYLPQHNNSNLHTNDYELYKLRTFSNVPTISKKVEMESDQTLHTSSTLCTEGKIIKRRGIRGVSWIFRLALKDNSIGKIYRTQIGWTLLILVIFVTFAALLGCFSKYFLPYHLVTFNNYSNVSPKYELKDSDVTNDNLLNRYNESATTTTEQDISTTVYHKISTRLTTLSSTIFVSANQTGTNKLNEYKTDSALNMNGLKNKSIELSSNNQFTNTCSECRKSLDVCIASAESGIPTCQSAIDVGDPTGCGGLCALEIEACHLLDHKHSIYTCTPLETYKKCTTDEWKCRNHLCIPKSKHCDGEINCYDRSDEVECDSCDLAQNFHCGNKTSCLDNSKKCNGFLDCWDASDEVNCTIACPESQFTCNSGECILGSLFCDGLPDCRDKSDEPIGCEGKCKKHEFKCTNTRCIPKWRVCNGTDNCGDMSDELDCPHVKTSS